MANLFSRVALKNGDRGGEVTVQAQPFGDVPHLRRGVPMPPTPLDGKPLPLDSTADRRAYFADWLTAPDNPYFAQGPGQPRLAQLPGPRPGRGGGRPAADQSADQRGTARRPGEGLHRPQVRCQASLIRTVMNSATYQRSAAAAARQRDGRSLLFALPDPPAAGRGDPRRLRPGDRRADAVQGRGHWHDRRHSGDDGLSAWDAGPAVAGHAGGVALPRRLRPARTRRRPAPANGSRIRPSARPCT